MTDPNYYRGQAAAAAQTATLRTLTKADLEDVDRLFHQVLERTGLLPHPPIDLEGQRRLGLQTLLQEARRCAVVLSRVVVEVEGKPTYPHGRAAAQLTMVAEGVEKEWRL